MAKNFIFIGKYLRFPVMLAFLSAGVFKLIGAPELISMFEHFQLPIWFMYVTGVVEVAGAIGLYFWQTRLGALSSLVLMSTMIVGAGFHFQYDTFQEALPALSLAAISFLLLVVQKGATSVNRIEIE